MRTILILSAITTGLAWAQNGELALLGGISGVQGQTSVAGSTKASIGTVSPSFQVNYAWQLLERKAGLFVELPLVIPLRVRGETLSSPAFKSSVGNSGPDIFFTPGVRLKISPHSRVSFYAAAGFGIASFGATSFILPDPTIVSMSRRNSPALGFGGGVDVRLTRLLSLRGDVRDLVTKKGLGGVTGRNHGIFQTGLVFHF